MSCEAVHPEFGATCILGGNHANHLCRVDGMVVPVQWENTAFVAPPAKKKWTPRPPRAHGFAELKEAQEEGNFHARNETARLEATLFANTTATPAEKLARAGGSETTKRAATAASYRSKSQKAQLLAAYVQEGEGGLTDEQAADRAGLLQRPRCCWWHRCSDLVDDGMIEPLEGVTRKLSTGMDGRVCVPTAQGVQMAGRLFGGEQK